MFATSSAFIVMLIIAGLPACTAFPCNADARKRIFSEIDGDAQEFDIPSYPREISMGDAVLIEDPNEGDSGSNPDLFVTSAECGPSDYECGKPHDSSADYDTDDAKSQDDEEKNPGVSNEDTPTDCKFEETGEEEDDDDDKDDGDGVRYNAINESDSGKIWVSEDDKE